MQGGDNFFVVSGVEKSEAVKPKLTLQI